MLSLLPVLILLLLIPLKDTLSGAVQAEYDHAWRLFQQGNLVASQREAEAASHRLATADPRWSAKFQLLAAEAMVYRGMNDGALQDLVVYRDYGDRESAVQKLTIEAYALSHQGELSQASERLAQADAICGATDYKACGEVLVARGILTIKTGRFAEARQQFLRALAFANSHHDPWLEATVAINLGYIALQVDHYDEAVDWSKSAVQRATQYGYENIVQGAAGNLGWAFLQLGDHERALEQFINAGKSAERLGNVHGELKWLSTAGYVYSDSANYALAMQSFRQALYLAQQIDSKEDIANALEDLAQTSVLSGNLKEASAYFDRVAALEVASQKRLSPNLMLTQGLLAAATHQDEKAVSCFQALQDDPASRMMIRLSAASELAKLAEAHGDQQAAEDLYKKTLATYESARSTLKKEETELPFGANAAEIYDRYIHLLMQQGRAEEALLVADQSRARTLEQTLDGADKATIARVTALKPRQIAQRVHANLLFYWLGEKQSYLWAITPAQFAVFTLPARQQIADSLDRYRKTILGLRDPLRTANPDGQSLYNVLVSPAARLIRKGVPVVILADGELSQFNFETLLVPEPVRASETGAGTAQHVHYLIDDWTLVSAPSLAMLAAPSAERGQGRNLLLLGNPVSPSVDFPSLPLFGVEMARVENRFGKGQMSVFAGQQATPATYLSGNPAKYSYIHFVSHAVANRTDPLDSAIVLSRSSTDENSFKLYARDIIQHPIDARLVTISACYGSGTRSYAGEGLVGLSWAFLRAGAQRVIGSLWEVSDSSTPGLMDTLYAGLQQGNSPAASLRKAKLELLHSQGRFSLPFYWATFQMYDRQ